MAEFFSCPFLSLFFSPSLFSPYNPHPLSSSLFNSPTVNFAPAIQTSSPSLAFPQPLRLRRFPHLPCRLPRLSHWSPFRLIVVAGLHLLRTPFPSPPSLVTVLPRLPFLAVDSVLVLFSVRFCKQRRMVRIQIKSSRRNEAGISNLGSCKRLIKFRWADRLKMIRRLTVKIETRLTCSQVAMCNFPTIKDAADVVVASMLSDVQVSRVELLIEVQVRAVNIANGKNLPEFPTLMFEFIGNEVPSRRLDFLSK
ncbi:hypothetical protein ACOSQ4_010739 [Xanthoceras sorbifolium]